MTGSKEQDKVKDGHDRIAYWTDRFHRSQGWWKPWMTWATVGLILVAGATAIILPYILSLNHLSKFLHCPLSFAKLKAYSEHLFGLDRNVHYSEHHHDGYHHDLYYGYDHLGHGNDNDISKKNKTLKPGLGQNTSSTTKRNTIHCRDYYGKSTSRKTTLTTKMTSKTTTKTTTTQSRTTQTPRRTTRKCIHANDPRLKWRLPKNKTGNKPYIKSMDYQSQEMIDKDFHSSDLDKDDDETDEQDTDKQHGDDTMAEDDEKELKKDLQKENDAYLQHNHNYLMQLREAKDTAELKERLDSSVRKQSIGENSNVIDDENIQNSGNYLVQFKNSGNDLILDNHDLDQEEHKTEARESYTKQTETKKRTHFKNRRKNIVHSDILLNFNEYYRDDSDDSDKDKEHSDEDEYYYNSPHEARIKADFEKNKIHLLQFKNSVKDLEGDKKLEKTHEPEYDQENSDEYLKQTNTFVEEAKIYEKDVRNSNLDYLKHHENVLSEMKLDRNDVERLKDSIEDILFLRDFEPKTHNSLKKLQHLRERDENTPNFDESENDIGDNDYIEKSSEGQIIPVPPDYNSLHK